MMAGCVHALALVAAMFSGTAAAQDFPETSNLRQASGLASACRSMGGMDPLCAAYLIGAIDGTTNGQVLEAMGRGDRSVTPFHCAPASLTYGEIAQIFVTEVDRDPSFGAQPSVMVLASALRRNFPCN